MLGLLLVAMGAADEARLDALEATVHSLRARLDQQEATIAKQQEIIASLVKNAQPAEPVRQTKATATSATGRTSPITMEGRRASESSSCCRWTSDGVCGNDMTFECTRMHEWLEAKTTTHEFEDIDECLGTSTQADWSHAYHPTQAEVALSSGGSEVARVKTPLKVRHAANCSSNASALTLQMNTDVSGSFSVNGKDVGDALAWLIASTHVGGGSVVSLKGANDKYMGIGYSAYSDTPTGADSVGAHEQLRIRPAPGYMFCIYTSHDSSKYDRLLVSTGAARPTVGNANEECTSDKRWQIILPDTTEAGTDWATATGDAERVLIYGPNEGKYLGWSGNDVVFTTSWTEAESWKITIYSGFATD